MTQQPDFFGSTPHRSKFPAEFQAWLIMNEYLYQLFIRFALQARRAGVAHYGAKAIEERMRWHTQIDDPTDTEYKINAKWTAAMARLAMMEFPALKDFFRCRESHYDSCYEGDNP